MVTDLPNNIKIPSNITYIQGTDGVWEPEFESDFDKAVYYAGKSPNPRSKNQKNVIKWIYSLGVSFDEIKDHRKKILEKLKDLTTKDGAWDDYPNVLVPPVFQSFSIEQDEEDELPEGLEELIKEVSEDEEDELPEGLEELLDTVRRTSVVSKKVDINRVLNRKPSETINPNNLKPEDTESENTEEKSDSDDFKKDVNDGINKILGSLITIKSLLDKQRNVEERTAKTERRSEEKREQKELENKLEKKKEEKEKTEKMPEVKPIGGFFDMIKRFFTNILIGGVVLKIFNWINDPNNKSSVERFKNFMVNNAPLILGGLLAIAALPLVSTILGFLAPITSILIPAITAAISFLASPAGLAALAVIAGITVASKAGNRFKQVVQKEMISTGVTKKGTAFSGGDIVELRKRQEEFMVHSGVNDKAFEAVSNKYENLLSEMRNKRNIEKRIVQLEMTPDHLKWRSDPELKKKKEELEKSSKKITNLFGELNISDSDLKQLQMETGARKKDETYMDLSGTKPNALQNIATNLGRLTGSDNSTPSTPIVPRPSGGGLPPSASNTGSVIEYITGDAGHPNFEYEGHGTTSNYHDHIAFKTIEDKERAKAALRSAGIQIGSESRPWDTDSYHSQGLAIDIPGAQWGGRGAIGETEYAGSRKVRAVLAAAGFSGGGIDTSGSVRAPSPSAQIARTPVSAPSISSPTGRSGIGILPMPMGGGGSKGSTSGSGSGQTKLPFFSSEDPNNMTMMVVKGIYNVVG